MAGRTREGGSEREEGEHCSQSGGVGGYDAAVPGQKKLPTPRLLPVFSQDVRATFMVFHTTASSVDLHGHPARHPSLGEDVAFALSSSL